jgi:hypothetical protein
MHMTREPWHPNAPSGVATGSVSPYPCAACGRYGADYFPAGTGGLHRVCAGLGPDVLAWPWLLLAYSLVVPFGCTMIGAALASIPYYLWRGQYPNRAKAYNRHVWIAFAICCVVWFGLFVSGLGARP